MREHINSPGFRQAAEHTVGKVRVKRGKREGGRGRKRKNKGTERDGEVKGERERNNVGGRGGERKSHDMSCRERERNRKEKGKKDISEEIERKK